MFRLRVKLPILPVCRTLFPFFLRWENVIEAGTGIRPSDTHISFRITILGWAKHLYKLKTKNAFQNIQFYLFLANLKWNRGTIYCPFIPNGTIWFNCSIQLYGLLSNVFRSMIIHSSNFHPFYLLPGSKSATNKSFSSSTLVCVSLL